MQRAKRIYLLLGVLAVVCAAAFAVSRYQEEQERIRNTDEVVLEVDPDTVDSLSWTCEGESLAFHKDGSWLYDEDSAFPVDEEKVQALLENFQALGAAFIIEDVTDYAQYGLDDPVCTIDITAGDTAYQITLGDYSTMDSQRYLSTGDGNVYLVEDDPLEDFDIPLSEMIDNDETPDFDSVESLQFTGADSYTAVYQEDSGASYCSDDVYFKQERDSLSPLDTDRVQDYLDEISGLDLTNYVSYNATEEEIADCGLDQPELTVTIRYTDEPEEGEEEATAETADTPSTFTIRVSRDPDQRTATPEEAAQDEEEEDEEEITAYLRVNDSQILYQITGSEYEALMAAGYNDLRHQEVLSADFADVTGLEVTLEGQTYTITSKGSGEDRTFLYNEEELDIEDLQDALEDLTATEFTDETPAQKEEISLTVSLDNETFPQVVIRLYRYDGETCLAVVDGSPVCLVERSAVVDLIEAVNAIVL